MDALENLNKQQEELLVVMQENGFLNNQIQGKDYIESAYIHVNSACNLHCLGCYSFVENRNDKKELNLNEWEQIVQQLIENGVRNIVISGGEPFLRSDLKEICKAINKYEGVNLEVITNGTLPIEKYEAVLPYISALNISIDGYDDNSTFIRDKGIMPTVLSNIDKLKSRTKVKLIVTLHKKKLINGNLFNRVCFSPFFRRLFDRFL